MRLECLLRETSKDPKMALADFLRTPFARLRYGHATIYTGETYFIPYYRVELASPREGVPFAFLGSAFRDDVAVCRAGWLSPSRIEETANFLMANMAFFFLPPAVEIINNIGTVRPVLFKLAAIVAASTAITFFAAYGTVCALQKLARGKDA